MKEEKTIPHYGKILKKYIKRSGIKKSKIATDLKITRPTLNTRLLDNDFSEIQIEKIKSYIEHEAR